MSVMLEHEKGKPKEFPNASANMKAQCARMEAQHVQTNSVTSEALALPSLALACLA